METIFNLVFRTYLLEVRFRSKDYSSLIFLCSTGSRDSPHHWYKTLTADTRGSKLTGGPRVSYNTQTVWISLEPCLIKVDKPLNCMLSFPDDSDRKRLCRNFSYLFRPKKKLQECHYLDVWHFICSSILRGNRIGFEKGCLWGPSDRSCEKDVPGPYKSGRGELIIRGVLF